MAVRNISELRHRITLQKPKDELFDEHGSPLAASDCWEDVRTVWALCRDISGKEFFEAHATQALDIVIFETRALRDTPIDNGWSILFRGARYEVVHINHRDYKGQWLEIRTRWVRPELEGGG